MTEYKYLKITAEGEPAPLYYRFADGQDTQVWDSDSRTWCFSYAGPEGGVATPEDVTAFWGVGGELEWLPGRPSLF